MSRLEWLQLILMRYYRSLGLRVTFYALLSLIAALVSPLLKTFLGEPAREYLDFESVVPVLTILASSMLAVSTFSLNIMVSAHRAAASQTTPRVHRILLENTTTQSVLAAFIGAFVYSLSSIILYRVGFYAEGAAIVVMAVTIFVVVLIIVAMLRWIHHLTNLGSVEDSLHSAVVRSRMVLDSIAAWPALGANPLSEDTILPDALTPVRARENGYLQLIDVSQLQQCLADNAFIYVTCAPGTHVLEGEVIAHVSGSVDDGTMADLRKGFTIGNQRTFEQDAVFGLDVLSEIASKALSPGINDAGTAIEAILRLKSLLWDHLRAEPADDEMIAPNVFVPVVTRYALFKAAFLQIARDGAHTIEVAESLRTALKALSALDDPSVRDAARKIADEALKYSAEAGLLETEMARLRRIDLG